jgi:cysteine desulfurase/selenocysteine lyase
MIEKADQININLKSFRVDFPILNKPNLVYLDSAATAQKPLIVIEAMRKFMLESNGTVRRGVYNLSTMSTQAFDAARERVRNFINAKSSKEIIFTRGTTEAINLVATSFCSALRGIGSHLNTSNEPRSPLYVKTENLFEKLPDARHASSEDAELTKSSMSSPRNEHNNADGTFRIGSDIEILISGLEHHANIVPWQINATRIGATIKVIPVLDNGELDQDAYSKLLSSGKVKLLALTHISNALGTINPIKEMISLAHKYNVAVLIDGAQGITHTQVNVQDLDADFYVFSGHKLYGPTGVGVLYGKEELLNSMPAYHGGGEMIDRVRLEKTRYADLPFKFEAGTPPIVEVIGLGEAIKYIESIGMKRIADYEKLLHQYCEDKLQEIDGLRIIGQARDKASISSFVFNDIGSFDIGTMLNEHGIAVRTGHHCAQPVMDRFGIDSTTRISIAFYNNIEDIDRCIEALKQTVKIFR